MQYNPSGIIDMSKGRMAQRVGYKKGSFLTDLSELTKILENGGQVELRAQEVRINDREQVQVLECRIYFVTPHAE